MAQSNLAVSLPAAGAAREWRHPLKVYFEDTDCVGVVYHANYLKYLERARTEVLNETGTGVVAWAERGVSFVVHKLSITYKAAARLGDSLVVVTGARTLSPYRMVFLQRVEREADGKLLAEAEVEIACTDREGRLRPVPAELLDGSR